eukprot:scaffold272613_cov15-Prasinocladus_malaysianus.AAC.1
MSARLVESVVTHGDWDRLDARRSFDSVLFSPDVAYKQQTAGQVCPRHEASGKEKDILPQATVVTVRGLRWLPSYLRLVASHTIVAKPAASAPATSRTAHGAYINRRTLVNDYFRRQCLILTSVSSPYVDTA